VTVLTLPTTIEPGADKEVFALFAGPRRKLTHIFLRNGAVLGAHKSPVPIAIHCTAGSGTLKVDGLDATLETGTLVTLEPDVVHEVVATPSVSFVLTQFTDG
jgi:quercetin dioxygenase-like cupin family protein